jgi:hypothetical protein
VSAVSMELRLAVSDSSLLAIPHYLTTYYLTCTYCMHVHVHIYTHELQ